MGYDYHFLEKQGSNKLTSSSSLAQTGPTPLPFLGGKFYSLSKLSGMEQISAKITLLKNSI